MKNFSVSELLPVDANRATLVGRVWCDGPIPGPSIIAVREGEVVDITAHAPTMADLLDRSDAIAVARSAAGVSLGSVSSLLTNPDGTGLSLLAPCDVQAIKACGVTFAVSMLERVIEEQAHGNAAHAAEIRAEIQKLIGDDLSRIKPGSAKAEALKEALQRRNAWSQYMEVGIGPYAEVFSKAQPMSAVGFGAQVGLLPDSNWNNPEPEIVLAVDRYGRSVGATLGNDVNLRDIEGLSALLLGKAKDNNGSCAIGPFIRLFDDDFSIDTVREAKVSLLIEGEDDDFVLEGVSDMREISRDPLDLVQQTCGAHHQYPDGFMLFLGTMFSPVKDRGVAGSGFTHHLGDRVSIRSPSLGTLVNTVQLSTTIDPWTFGVRALYRNLAARGLLT
ncbi:fumarylacetoacetate hydrolase family protein [Pusillimonas sp. ANT_WB101]|uniref:fumarylacetoacetate hydrolase family protein n=1 Tax=Pusillimonas sp. ANT_WB101 TaxID=2597356 RepID=UPI0011F059C1|nr:fumarylacetoacetate hydrolase family protein [Pusillimonas sp. ANT_WB101]KAA0891194.1 fumarylacetoacetate hydrolase family protein [Pusillimonas sp. ANT_WB101]